jgi:hypothetical protein
MSPPDERGGGGGGGGDGSRTPPRNGGERDRGVATSAEKSRNDMFQAFLQHARSRGFFDGCDKGTREYNHKVQQCIVKFENLRKKQGYPV